MNIVFIYSLVARDKGSKLFLKVSRISILFTNNYKLVSRLLLLFRGIVLRVVSFSFIYEVFTSWFLVGTSTKAFVSIASAIASNSVASTIASTLVVALVYEVSALILYKVST